MGVVTKRQHRAATEWIERLENRAFYRCGPNSYHVLVLPSGTRFQRSEESEPRCPLHESNITIVVYETEPEPTRDQT
jgi:hypothetical protein